MRDDSQSGSDRGGPDLDDAGQDDPGGRSADFGGAGWSGLDPRGSRGKPWFGRKTIGYGYGPRTWQGFLVTAVSAALVVIVGSVTKGHGPLFFGVIALVVAVHLAIIIVQRR